MTSSWNCCTFVLILLSTYVLCSCSKLAMKKVDVPKQQTGATVVDFYKPEQQISHATTAAREAETTANQDETRHKRSQHELSSSEYRNLNDIIDDLEDNSLAVERAPAHEVDFENMPPLTYYLLLQKLKQLQTNEPTYRVRTPRLGRSIDWRQLDMNLGPGIEFDDSNAYASNNNYNNNNNNNNNIGALRQPKQFMSRRLIKKSVPFKPRLGKRTQQQQAAMLCD